jgi:hypothetical protein
MRRRNQKKYTHISSIGKLDLSSLVPNQKVLFVRSYSHVGENLPDYQEVSFKNYDSKKKIVEFETDNTNKTINSTLAEIRMFVDYNRMARALYECFALRDLESPEEFNILFFKSQEMKPELWI